VHTSCRQRTSSAPALKPDIRCIAAVALTNSWSAGSWVSATHLKTQGSPSPLRYVCIYVYKYLHTYVCMYVFTYVCVYLCMYVCMCVCTCLHTYVCICACMYACMYICMHIRIYTRMCVFVHVCMFAWDQFATFSPCNHMGKKIKFPFKVK
jgi:hypothetical protein